MIFTESQNKLLKRIEQNSGLKSIEQSSAFKKDGKKV